MAIAVAHATTPDLTFDHLVSLTTPLGLFEHAMGAAPQRDHGYCLDDVARGLVVTARQPRPGDQVLALSRVYLEFTLGAQDDRGRFRNRRRANGAWMGDANVDDHWGRALWGLGTAAAASPDEDVRDAALRAATLGFQTRSTWTRATAYAALGAYEILRVHPGNPAALGLLADARTLLAGPPHDPSWPWPEPRLTYANAVLPEALLVIGAALKDDRALADGLRLLAWLVELETRGDHLSVTPAGGWRLGEPRPGFDQQPIEVSALAEACWRAYAVTGNRDWLTPIERAVAWFAGANDLGLALYDPTSGGGSDGLHADRINENRGAESTLAGLATFQLGHRAAAAHAR
jgi:hypothetical protein